MRDAAQKKDARGRARLFSVCEPVKERRDIALETMRILTLVKKESPHS